MVLPKKESSGSCYRCGHTAHKAAQCPYKEAKCHTCGKVGHLVKRVCRKADKADKSRKQAKVKMVPDAAPDTSPQPATEYHLFGGVFKTRNMV